MSPKPNDRLHAQSADFAVNPPDGASGSSFGSAANPSGDRPQVWIIGTRDQVIHLMNEFYVKKIASDRAKFTPIVPAPFAKDKFM
ncbi:MAG: hypothetical protein D6742_03435, partial [Cyanobacteria bacterium J069]